MPLSQSRKICKLEIPCARLFDAKFFGILIEHEPVTCDERNAHQAPLTFESLARDALNKRVTFEHRRRHLAAQLRSLEARDDAQCVLAFNCLKLDIVEGDAESDHVL